MIDRDHELPLTHQAQQLEISRGSIYYLPRPVSSADLAIMRRIDGHASLIVRYVETSKGIPRCWIFAQHAMYSPR